uniref:DndE family protein n=1 Tax=Ornithobacterium rhinotracheale TaxID=28251 RepID=UPI00129C14A0|nr:DndE family protein [Ornithobacterium rhinotracheale]
MIRFKIDKESTDILDRITKIYNFRRDTITSRIAIALSFSKGAKFSNIENIELQQNGREYTPTSNIFGRYIHNVDNYIIYKTIFDQHYAKSLSEIEFIALYKLHLKDGLSFWNENIKIENITAGEHVTFLSKQIKKGLSLRTNLVSTHIDENFNNSISEFKSLLTFELGKKEDGTSELIRLNDLQEFDNRNIAIAGMAGSGKTQLIKDILYQISKNTDNQLKFIFFDYKGEGNIDQLKPFLDASKCNFVDIVNDGGVKFNPFKSISLNPNQKPFSIKAFVDTISFFVPGMGISQKNILTNIITELFENKNSKVPSISELFDSIKNYYGENKMKPDSLYAIINDLNTNIFNCTDEFSIFNENLYLNLPPALSDTLRQLVVFLLLRYFNSYFSSLNDCVPQDNIFPLRYVIVIDEAHIYLRNKNARKALEELLRLLRSKGVVIIMLSQGVEDYKTKDFDFASQVKIPICLNIQNKDFKSICNFLGTPNSRMRFEEELSKLDSGKGLINLTEPQIIQLRQWWITEKKEF